MNGHWVSNTRKLNKHYQNADGSYKYVDASEISPCLGLVQSEDNNQHIDSNADITTAVLFFPKSFKLKGTDSLGRIQLSTPKYKKYVNIDLSEDWPYAALYICKLPPRRVITYNYYNTTASDSGNITILKYTFSSGYYYTAQQSTTSYFKDLEGNTVSLYGKLASEVTYPLAIPVYQPVVYFWYASQVADAQYTTPSDGIDNDTIIHTYSSSNFWGMLEPFCGGSQVLIPNDLNLLSRYMYSETYGLSTGTSIYSGTEGNPERYYGFGYNYTSSYDYNNAFVGSCLVTPTSDYTKSIFIRPLLLAKNNGVQDIHESTNALGNSTFAYPTEGYPFALYPDSDSINLGDTYSTFTSDSGNTIRYFGGCFLKPYKIKRMRIALLEEWVEEI